MKKFSITDIFPFMLFCLLPFILLYTINISIYFAVVFISVVSLFAITWLLLVNGNDFYHGFFTPKIIIIYFFCMVFSSLLNRLIEIPYIDELVYVVFIFFAILSYFLWFNRQAPIIESYLLFFLVFIFFGIISTIYNGVPLKIGFLGFILAVQPVLFFLPLTFINLKDGYTLLIPWLDRFFCFFVLSSFFWVICFELLLGWNPVPGDIGFDDGGLSFVRGYFGHPGAYSSVMFLCVNYFFAKYLFVKNKKTFILSLAGFLCLILSLRLKAILLLPVTLFCIYYIFGKKYYPEFKYSFVSIRVKVFCLICVGLLFLGGTFFHEKIKFYIYSGNARTNLFLTSIQVSMENYGLGAGFGRYGSAISERYYSPLYYKYGLYRIYGLSPNKSNFITDQWWGWYIGETGLLGMFFFVSGISMLLIKLKRLFDNINNNEKFSVLILTSIAGLIYGLLSGFAAGNLTGPPTGPLVMGLSGLAVGIGRVIQSQTNDA